VTVTCPVFRFAKAVETNIVEEDGEPVKSDGESFTVTVRPWSYATIRLIR
jgi:hypothetical protein